MFHSNKYKTLAVVCLFTVISISILPGCKKNFLDRQPLSRYTQDNYPFPAGGGVYDQYIFAAYSSLRHYAVSSFAFILATSVRSDDADVGSSFGDASSYGTYRADNFPVTPDYPFPNDLWNAYYGDLIYNCNLVLQRVAQDSSGTEESVKESAIAEAKFLRGYAYFTLERLFANIPIIDKVLSVDSSVVPQSTPEQVYAFIEQDLQYAAAHLPLRSEWDSKFIGRATSGAAWGMLAKVYLYEKKWQQAMDAAATVINSNQYDLKTNYQDIWKNSGENCSESLFEIQCYADANHQQGDGVDNNGYGCQYASVQGVRGASGGPEDLGWGFNNPSHYLHLAYEPGDPRIKSTLLFVRAPQASPTIYGETFPTASSNDSIYNMKVYLGNDPSIRQAVGNRQAWWENVRILRYADVVLIYAEAANEAGNTTEALDKLEWIRARARAGNNSILPKVTVTDKDELRTKIQQERRIELAMEHERFFDIVRWGIAADALHKAKKTGFTTGRDELLPIPQLQIDLSQGVLHQNPGY